MLFIYNEGASIVEIMQISACFENGEANDEVAEYFLITRFDRKIIIPTPILNLIQFRFRNDG